MMATVILPEEVVIEILSWLPAKALFRSRCVCRAWLRLFTIDPHFHNLHLHHLFINNHPKHNPSIFLKKSLNNFFYLSTTATQSTERHEAAVLEIQCPFKIPFPPQHLIFGICNGLVCMASPSIEKFPTVNVWNPLTKDQVTISCPPIPSHFPYFTSITYGFGFCQFTTEFKVIRVLSSMVSDEFKSDVSVYTLGTNSWRTLGSIPYDIDIEHHFAFVSDALHWFGASPGSFVPKALVSFNMKEEIFQEVPHPNIINYSYPNRATIGELRGLLCIFHAFCKEYVEIWVMKEYGNVDSWTKQFRIGRPEVSGGFNFLHPLGLADGGEIIIEKNGREIILYNPLTNSIRTLKEFGCWFYGAYPCIGSIVSPRLVNGVNTSSI